MRTTEEYRTVTLTVKIKNADGNKDAIATLFQEPCGHRSLNMPSHCPTCDTLVRTLSGHTVDARFSSPYDGEFDPKFHADHVCEVEKSPELSQDEVNNALEEAAKVNPPL
jgi:hypothetical protein